MSYAAENWAWNLKLESSNLKFILMSLAKHVREDNSCFPSINYLADHCCMHRTTVINCINRLVELNLIKKEARNNQNNGNTSNLYILNVDKEYTKMKDITVTAKKYTPSSATLPPWSRITTPLVVLHYPNNYINNYINNKPPKPPETESQNPVDISANVVCENYTYQNSDNGTMRKFDHPATKIAAGDVIKINGLTENCYNSDSKNYEKNKNKHEVRLQESEIQFTKFWKSYPALKKGARSIALKSWKKLNPSPELFDQILLAITNQTKERELFKKLGVFHANWPYASTWLNQHVWEDEVCLDEKLIIQSAPTLKKETREHLEKQELAEKRKRAEEGRKALEARQRAEEVEWERTKSERIKSGVQHMAKLKDIISNAIKRQPVNDKSTPVC